MRERTARALFLGRRAYGPVHDLMLAVRDARIAGVIGDVFLFVEHEPVITLGRGAKPENILSAPAALHARGVSVHETGRGGDVTFHGPGQLVGYPILDLKPDRCDLRRYVRALAEVMICVARDHHVEAGTMDGMIGVWADAGRPSEWAGEAWARAPAKLGAIGVRVSRWVTMHGFALNATVDLESFRAIVPCGIREHPVASIESLTGRAPSVRELALSIAPHLRRGMDYAVTDVMDLGERADDELLALVLGAARASTEEDSP